MFFRVKGKGQFQNGKTVLNGRRRQRKERPVRRPEQRIDERYSYFVRRLWLGVRMELPTLWRFWNQTICHFRSFAMKLTPCASSLILWRVGHGASQPAGWFFLFSFPSRDGGKILACNSDCAIRCGGRRINAKFN